MVDLLAPPNPNNLCATPILNFEDERLKRLATDVMAADRSGLQFLRKSHLHLVQLLKPVYSVNEKQPASLTLERQRGSCSQRIAVLEAIARAAGIPTRVYAFEVRGRFWYPRFRFTRPFIPRSVLLLWPQFHVENKWVDFDELHAPIDQIAANAESGFTNAGESLFEAITDKPVDFQGKTCGLACHRPEHDLSKYVANARGMFDTRDQAFERLGSFQDTLRGRTFELIFGDRKSS
jgi:hypothetical protein